MAKLTQLFHEPGALLNDFVVNWSADNKVAVATQNSVCIYVSILVFDGIHTSFAIFLNHVRWLIKGRINFELK